MEELLETLPHVFVTGQEKERPGGGEERHRHTSKYLSKTTPKERANKVYILSVYFKFIFFIHPDLIQNKVYVSDGYIYRMQWDKSE